MTDEQLALARRAVACRKWWAWMPGMLDAVLGRVIAVHDDEIVFHDYRVADFFKIQPDSPDLTDPATRGCLLELVRQAWGDPTASVWYDDAQWGCGDGWSYRCGVAARCQHASESEALVEALEAAT